MNKEFKIRITQIQTCHTYKEIIIKANNDREAENIAHSKTEDIDDWKCQGADDYTDYEFHTEEQPNFTKNE